ncbi:MAG: HAMP domain-containing sensor histidine kinase [Tepidisphaeraceae bacterium]|jgi:signal transduction histidine kinase
MMTLRRKLAYQITTLVVSLLAAGVASIWQINAMQSDFNAALLGYQRLRNLSQVGTHVAAAKLYLGTAYPDRNSAHLELVAGLDSFNREFPPDAPSLDAALEQRVRASLAAAANADLDAANARPATLDAALNPMFDLDKESRDAIQSAYDHANHHLSLLMYGISGLLAGVALIAMVIGIAQYRSILWPLARMKLAVERIASGRFNGRVDTQGTREFAELAMNFNRMAARLEDLYHNLQQRVEAKSRQLVRNERLASVGLLAAGVAHEINNPLSIMTAHAELSLGAIERGDETAHAESARSLQVICEEAFRCKRIVEKLLTLGRGPQEAPSIFSLGSLVREAVASVSAMPEYHDRILTVTPANGIDDRIRGRSDEIKQVVLNLVFNALEATTAGGSVRVNIAADRKEVELSVTDSGRGMPDAVLDQIFEPFYTDSRGKAEARPSAAATDQDTQTRRGTGLGLSIAHAIVLRHGGEIRAHSDGPGRGSRFTVVLPIASFDVDEELDQ